VPEVGIHVLRHSAAAALIASGANVKAVSTILGHRSVAFTLTTYGHLFDDDLDAVARDLDSFTTRKGVRTTTGTHAPALTRRPA
jgi:integrase